VTVLTINANDPTRDHVKRWLETRGYDFPVLWSGGYHQDAGVTGFPTTWVVDRQGRLVFDVMGIPVHFGQEYGWRVEALLEE
jgi:hypothetical protein